MVPQDIIIKNGVNLHIEVKDPEDSISGAEPPEDSFPATEAEEAGFINIVTNHHMFPVEKIAIRVTSAESFTDRTLVTYVHYGVQVLSVSYDVIVYLSQFGC